MSDFLKRWLVKRIKDNDSKIMTIVSSLNEKQIKHHNMYSVFYCFPDDKIDTALDALAVIQQRNSEIRKDAVDYLFKEALSFDNVKELDEKGFVLAQNSLKYGFKPCSDGLTRIVDTDLQDTDELAAVISETLSVVQVKKEDLVIKSEIIKDFEFRYYSFLSLADLINLHDGNVIIDQRSIFDNEIRKQFSHAVNEKNKKLDVEHKNKKDGSYKL